MNDPWRDIARAARKLLDIHAELTPEEWERLSPRERRFIADTFTQENLDIMRELAEDED